MIRISTDSTRTYTLWPYTTLCRTLQLLARIGDLGVGQRDVAPVVGPGIVQDREDQFRFLVEALLVHPADDDAGVALARRNDPLDQRWALLGDVQIRSEEHTPELKSLMRNSYAVFCFKKKTNN